MTTRHRYSSIEFQRRIFILFHLKQKILLLKNEILEALQKDLGKSYFEGYTTEVHIVLSEIDLVLKNLRKWMRPKKVKTPLFLQPGKSFIHYEPYGKVLIISPWNYPFQLLLSPLVGAIASGNHVTLKPSELSSYTEKVLVDLIQNQLSLPEIQIETGGVKETQELLKRKWDFIFFTGSTGTGKVIQEAAVKHLTPTCLELGGKSPCVVERNANIEVAAKRIAWGKFLNAGQTCVAPDYLLVHESIYEPFLRKIRLVVEQFYEGGSSKDYGKIINEKHFKRLENILNASQIIFGGKLFPKQMKIEPTLIQGDLEQDSMKEEIFGPILPVFKFKNFSEATDIIHNFEKPLSFYVFTRSEKLWREYIQNISFGGGAINDCVLHLTNAKLPFGGVGQSGFGSYHGHESFLLFSHKKSLLKKSFLLDLKIRYPPYPKKIPWFIKMLLKK